MGEGVCVIEGESGPRERRNGGESSHHVGSAGQLELTGGKRDRLSAEEDHTYRGSREGKKNTNAERERK